MNQIYYNFIRPHKALNRRTPAEVAGIGIKKENKWLEIVLRSAKINQSNP